MQVIEKARKRIAEIKAEMQRLEEFIETYTALEEDSLEILVDKPLQPTIRKRIRSGSNPKMIVRAAKDVIMAKNMPMTRSQLVDALEKRGLHIGGNDKSKNMGTIMWRSELFDNIEGHGYWPKDAPPWENDPLMDL